MSYLQPRINESEKIIKEAIERFGDNLAVGFSGGTDSLVVLNLVLPFKWDVKCIFVDTNYQFPETYEYINKLEKDWNLNLIRVKAEPKYDAMVEKYGNETSEFYLECCRHHKIGPMMRGIKEQGLEAFMVGIRGCEHETRAAEPIFSFKSKEEFPEMGYDHWRVHPIKNWSMQDVLDYSILYNLPLNKFIKSCFKIQTDEIESPNVLSSICFSTKLLEIFLRWGFYKQKKLLLIHFIIVLSLI